MYERKRNLTQGLLEKSKLAQHAYKEDNKICWKEAKVLHTEEMLESNPHGSSGSSNQSSQLGHLSHLDCCHSSRSQ
jgi:hypothetical protein